jgi:hypothetical protein
MGLDIRLPNINGKTDREQLAQVKSYLHQLAEQLQWALNTGMSGSVANVVLQTSSKNVSSTTGSTEMSVSDAQKAFTVLKPLIIKSADIVSAYYEEIDKLIDLSGKYTASSDFGDYTKETNNTISANSTSITQQLSRIETVESDVEGINSAIKEQDGYIKMGAVGTTLDDTGLAEESAPGIEIGDYQTLSDGVTTITNTRYARFTAYGLELFGSTLNKPVAYIKQYKLFITDMEITGAAQFGAFMIDTSTGFKLKYVGRK